MATPGEHHATATDQGPAAYDWSQLVDSLKQWLRLCTTPIGRKLLETVEALEVTPRIRRPTAPGGLKAGR